MFLWRKWKSQGFQAEAAGMREESEGLCRDLEDGAGRKSLSCPLRPSWGSRPSQTRISAVVTELI